MPNNFSTAEGNAGAPTTNTGGPTSFTSVYESELLEIDKSRAIRGTVQDRLSIKNDLIQNNLIGLAFSGGGIRSATFNLGVLQALAQNYLLSKIDYLSTVSGGGYIGSWLTSWAYRLHENSARKKAEAPEDKPEKSEIQQIEDLLRSTPRDIGDEAEQPEVHFLRKYSNYLTPRLGLLSGDTLAFVATYLRNLLLNQAILISALMVILLAPLGLGLFLGRFHGRTSLTCYGVAAVVFLLWSMWRVWRNVGQIQTTADSQPARFSTATEQGAGRRWRGTSAVRVFTLVAIPLFLSSLLLVVAIWDVSSPPETTWNAWFTSWLKSLRWAMVLLTGVGYTMLWVIAAVVLDEVARPLRLAVNRMREKNGAREQPLPATGETASNSAPANLQDRVGQHIKCALAGERWYVQPLAAFCAGTLGGALLLLISAVLSKPPFGQDVRTLVAFGLPMGTLAVLLVAVVQLGLIGRAYGDLSREWWARLGGIVLALALCWCAVCTIALFAPPVSEHLWQFLTRPEPPGWMKKTWKVLGVLGVTTAITGWVTATVAGLVGATSSQTGPRPQEHGPKSKIYNLLAHAAPPVFVAGLIVGLSLLLSVIVPAIHNLLGEPAKGLSGPQYWGNLSNTSGWVVLVLLLALGIVSCLLAWRVDVNEFSLHNAYRNRLVRCYLGATHGKKRMQQPFTGFDATDDINLQDLKGLGAPFHILNATLNVTKGKELALQERKARSFVFTPLYSGFESPETEKITDKTRIGAEITGAYQLTEDCSKQSPRRGIRLGAAMAISGAALSPNMGHFSSGAVSFLMTIFSVRLGWWLGNPRVPADWESKKPRSSWKALFRELTGTANEDRSEVYLSDGGHFENLGVYELVRRRCRVIIACDAGTDGNYECRDLASVIEKCRVDFGTEIHIKLEDIYPSGQLVRGGETVQLSMKPYAIGEISYPDHKKGKLIYIKPSLNADLPQDLLAYACSARDFPHQSTGDQYFDETQFESYRSLGFACASVAVEKVAQEIEHRRSFRAAAAA